VPQPPGNVRELAFAGVAPAAGEEMADPRSLREVERRHVRTVLGAEKGNKVPAARGLGISRRALYRPIEKYHLEGV
jgi:DNA-binding NtrC family response regulator